MLYSCLLHLTSVYFRESVHFPYKNDFLVLLRRSNNAIRMKIKVYILVQILEKNHTSVCFERRKTLGSLPATGYQKMFLNDPEKDVKPPKVKSIKA